MEKLMSAPAWSNVLMSVGVPVLVATKWAPVFEVTVGPKTFSKGPSELFDFLPTVLHEAQMLQRLRESGWYTAPRIRELGAKSLPGSRWRSLVPIADKIAQNEAAFFEACYGGRLGNDLPGDGARYPGRGLIMLTGKENYRWQGERSGQDLLQIPSIAEQPHFALEFAIDWWEGKVPDSKLGDSKAIRRVVNGGLFGIEDIDRLTALTRKTLVLP